MFVFLIEISELCKRKGKIAATQTISSNLTE